MISLAPSMQAVARMRAILALWLWVAAMVSVSAPAETRPRYIFFHIAPGTQWHQDRPETFTRDMFDAVAKRLAAGENEQLRVGLAFTFSTLETPTNVLERCIENLLRSSDQSGVPVLVALDGQNWWGRRPDLWNWWDTSKPGYNFSNVFNVEWTGWSPTNAVKIGWRNWGNQFRVPPAPNLASPRIVEAHLEPLRTLVPIIARWHRALPESRRWLFGGLKVGWEASIGINAFHYPDGNSFLEVWPNTAANDPKHGLDTSKGLAGGLSQLGFAAVSTAGIKRAGELTRDDIAQVVQQYLEKLARAAQEAGLPRDLVFTHQGGTYEPWDQHMPFWPATNAWSLPGWSFYGVAPERAAGVLDVINRSPGRQWCAAEWWWGGATAAEWHDHFKRTLDFGNCRFIDVYNWNLGMFEKEIAGHEAARKLVAEWRESAARESARTTRSTLVPLLRDPHLRDGCVVWDPAPGKHVERAVIRPKQDSSASAPAWGVAQWNSRFTLAEAAPEKLQSGAVRFNDAAKSVAFGSAGTADADVLLALDSSKEYGDRLRRSGEPWPHLLMEQKVESSPSLNGMAKLRFRIEVRLRHARAFKAEGWTDDLHAAQFSAFVTVQNLNRDSAGFGDYLWFGVPLYDSRHRVAPGHAVMDTAGTSKFIYTPRGDSFTPASAHDGQWITVDADLLPLIRKGLATAWEKDFLNKSRDPADFRISSFNIGWEMPGAFDVEMQIRNLALEAHRMDAE